MKSRLMLGLSTFLLAVGLVAAGDCIYGGGVTPPITISAKNVTSAAAWHQIADQLSALGDLHMSLEGPITIPVSLAGNPAIPIHMSKICNQTLKQAAQEVEKAAEQMFGGGGGGGAGGGGGGGGSVGVIGWTPVYSWLPGTACTGGGGCSVTWGWVLVGYEPVYGSGERQYSDRQA